MFILQNSQSIQFYGDLLRDASLSYLERSFGFLKQLLGDADEENMHECLAEHAEWRHMVQVPTEFMEMQRNRMLSNIQAEPLITIPISIDRINISGAIGLVPTDFSYHPRGGKLSEDSKALGSPPRGGRSSPHGGRPSLSLVDLIDGKFISYHEDMILTPP